MKVGSLLGLLLLSWHSSQSSSCAHAIKDLEKSPLGVSPTRVPVSISYQDLKDAFASADQTPSPLLVQAIEEAFGPNGLGLLEVSDVPRAMVNLRSNVLDMAQRLATLPPEELENITVPSSMYSIGWSHGKEQFQGEYDTGKGSFYFDPFYQQQTKDGTATPTNHNVYPASMQPHLEDSLMEISSRMAEIGLWVASLSDLYLEQVQQKQSQTYHSEKDQRNYDKCAVLSQIQSIRESLCNGKYAKGRLLYYFPIGNDGTEDSQLDSWCGWHKDHSCMTILMPGKLFEDDNMPKKDPSTMQESEGSMKPGLYIQSQVQTVHVQLPPTSVGVQLGETLEIMSRGHFRATRHAVRSSSNPQAGRASLALFLPPPLDTPLPQLYTKAEDDSLKRRWRPTYGKFQEATFKAFL